MHMQIAQKPSITDKGNTLKLQPTFIASAMHCPRRRLLDLTLRQLIRETYTAPVARSWGDELIERPTLGDLEREVL